MPHANDDDDNDAAPRAHPCRCKAAASEYTISKSSLLTSILKSCKPQRRFLACVKEVVYHMLDTPCAILKEISHHSQDRVNNAHTADSILGDGLDACKVTDGGILMVPHRHNVSALFFVIRYAPAARLVASCLSYVIFFSTHPQVPPYSFYDSPHISTPNPPPPRPPPKPYSSTNSRTRANALPPRLALKPYPSSLQQG
jgi:hypothetical protein